MSVVNIGITLFMSVEIGTMICLYTASQATTLLILAGVMVTMSGYPPAKYYLAAWGCYLLGVTGTLMNLLGFAPSSDFTRWGQFTGGAFEVAILSLALGARINEKRRQHVRQINELNQNLEKKVEERTAKIQSLLKHIPQGILSINRRGVLEENYSSQLTEILGREDIAYKPFKDLVLDRSDLSDDDKDQAYQTLTNTLGENYINFEANKDKLPKQINLICEDKTKTLRLTWNIEIDQDEEADHILVTLLDVSSEVAAQTELQRKNKEFELLQQLVEVNSNHSLQFFKSCDPLLDENRRLIEAGDLTLDTLKILFVNTHTIKGAARSLQLKALANELHKVESYYSQAVKEEQPINPDKIKEEFQQAELCYESYRAVNRDLLGRADDQSTIAIDRGFLHDNIKLLDNLVDVNEIPGDLQSIIHKNLNELTKKIFSNLQNIIENALSQANKIAGDLGKEPPHLYYDIDEIWVNHQQEEVIKNAFVHIVRNALDHGIEGGEQRRKKGKSPRGTINIKAFQRNHWIVINVEDDGSGLDLQKVREKSAALGLTREHTSAKDTAALIFEPGFSTADKISLLSGRGVGMGAVKQYIESIGGTVRIDSLQPIDEGQRYYQFKIAIRLPTEPGSSISKAS
jgi:signal transduction histidine kinase